MNKEKIKKLNKNLLLVEDDLEDRELIFDFLNKDSEDLEIDLADSLDSVAEKLGESDYKVILLDLSLSDSQGINTLEKVLSHSKDSAVVVLTGLKDDNLAAQAISSGAEDYIVKGDFTEDSLNRSIKNAQERQALKNELAETIKKLKRSNQELVNFGHIASHNLQEPLRKVISFGQRLKDKYHDELGQQGRDYIERMESATNRMQKMLDDFLSFSKVDAKDVLFHEVRLKEVVMDIVSDLELKINQSNATVSVSKEIPKVWGNTSQLRELFQCLISNSLKFRDEKEHPCIKIDASQEGDHWKITVTDNGIGFDEEHSEIIFEQLQRLHGRSEYEGTGMGLAIARKIALRHGGDVTARSKPKEGSTFTVSLPISEDRSDENDKEPHKNTNS